MKMNDTGIRIALVRAMPKYDSRLIKERVVLSGLGAVKSFTWARKRVDGGKEDDTSKEFCLALSRGSMAVVSLLPIFWAWLLLELIRYRPSHIHTTDLHTAIPAYIYRRIWPHTHIIYDMYDPLHVFFARNHMLRAVLWKLETKLFESADAGVCVSEERLQLMAEHVPKLCRIVPNYPITIDLSPQKKLSNDQLRVRYAGQIGDDFLTGTLLRACKPLSQMQLELAGPLAGDASTLLRQISECNAYYRGLLPYDQALAFISEADVVPVLYGPKLSNLSASSKFFEAMMLGVAIVANVGEEIIRKEACGIFLSDPTEENLRSALHYLDTHRDLLIKMGLNGKLAARRSYSWKTAASELVSLYSELDR